MSSLAEVRFLDHRIDEGIQEPCMLTHRCIFMPIAEQLLEWYGQYGLDVEHQLFGELSRSPRYVLKIEPAGDYISLDHGDEPTREVVITPRAREQRFSNALDTARCIARFAIKNLGAFTARQSELTEVLSIALLRQVSSDGILTLDLTSYRLGYRLGVTLTSRQTQRVTYNHGFYFGCTAKDDTIMTYENGQASLFDYYHQQVKGENRIVTYQGVASLEPLIHDSSRFYMLPGCWPMLGFVVLGRKGRPNQKGLGLKTIHGWIIIIHEPDNNPITPYRCYTIPDNIAQQFQISKHQDIGEESLSLLLSAGL